MLLGVVYTCIGKEWSRSRWVYRAEEPKRYWFEVTTFYLCGSLLIGLYLLTASN